METPSENITIKKVSRVRKIKIEAKEETPGPLPGEKPVVLKKTYPWGKISRASVYLLVFLLPLFFLPWTINALDYNKQIILGILVFIAFLAWLLQILASEKLEFNISRLNLPILALLLVVGLSTFFSTWRYGSFWGWPLDVGEGLLTLIYFVFLYFVIANALRKKEAIGRLAWLLVASAFLPLIFGLGQLFGKFLLPLGFTKTTNFNTVGTVNSLALLAAVLLPLAISLFFIAKKLWRLGLVIFILLMFATLIIVNFWSAWLVLIAGMALLFIFNLLNLKNAPRGLIQMVMGVLIIALFFVTFRISLAKLPSPPLEISLNQRAELGIVKSVILRHPFLGTGPGTFVYDFSKYKPQDINQSLSLNGSIVETWNIRFSNGASEILDRLIATGLLGIICWLSIFVLFFWPGFKYLKEKSLAVEHKKEWLLGLGLFSAFGGMILLQFLYPLNLSLALVFWVLLALMAALVEPKTKSFSIKPNSALAVGLSFVLVLILIFGVGLFFITAQKYIAEAKYLKGLTVFQQQGDTDKAIEYLSGAAGLNPKMDTYWRDISQLYLVKTVDTLQKQNISQEEKNSQLQILINNIMVAAKKATDINPANVANWNVMGFVYQNLASAVEGAADLAIDYYKKAVELEPVNPSLYTEIGRLYLTKFDLGQGNKEDNLKLASENFAKAVSLKTDFAAARYQMAMLLIREGKTEEAINTLKRAQELSPLDTGLAFQLGVIYYSDKQYDNAKVQLERVVYLDPNYSNARYLLGLIYDRQGDKDKAITQFEAIEKLNPDNAEIKKILANLASGQAALEGIVPSEPPVAEQPPEQLKK